MEYLLDLMIIIAALSISLNVAQFVTSKRVKKAKAEMSYDAMALLKDLSSGPALIKVEYVDRSEVLLRSPRHFN